MTCRKSLFAVGVAILIVGIAVPAAATSTQDVSTAQQYGNLDTQASVGVNNSTNGSVGVNNSTNGSLTGPALKKSGIDLRNVSPGLMRADGNASERIRVVFRLDGDIEKRVLRLESMGAEVESTYEQLVQAEIALSRLSEYRSQAWIEQVRRPHVATTNVVSEGVNAINASAVHQQLGVTGSNVKVGVLAVSGFDMSNSEIASNVAASKSFTSDGIENNGANDHGTGVAEIVSDVAPDSELYLANFETDVEYANAVQWMRANNVDVIVMSVSFFEQPYDGSGLISQVADKAVGDGIVWVNSAGNYREDHWQGQFQDADGDDILDFGSSGEINWLNDGNQIQAGDPVGVFLNWDEWQTTAQDYDLFLVDANGNVVARSTRIQDGDDKPTEFIFSQVPSDGRYGVAIKKYSATGNQRIELFAVYGGGLANNVPESSITAPAAGDRTTSVGAFEYSSGQMESFSSEGPTNDGDVGVNVAGPDRVTTTAYSRPFSGTSAAAPHVAGAAALVKAANSSLSPEQVEDALEQTAVDAAAPGLDTYAGYGIVDAYAAVQSVSGSGRSGSGLGVTVSQVSSSDFPTIETYVSVMDGNGNPVTGLTKQNFEVWENTTSTTSTTGALDVVFVIDGSGTMDDDIQAVRNSIKEFAATVEEGNDVRYGVVWYSDARIGQQFTRNVSALNQSLANRQGGTPEKAYEALAFALQDMSFRSNAQTVVLQFGDEEADPGVSRDPVDGMAAANIIDQYNAEYIAVSPPDNQTSDKDGMWPSNADIPYGVDLQNLAQDKGTWFDLTSGNLSDKFANEIAGTVKNASTRITSFSVQSVGSSGSDISTALVIDRSGSMAPYGLPDAKAAAKQFVSNFDSGDEGEVISFSTNVRIDQRWTTNTNALKSAIDSLSATSSTSLFDGVATGIRESAPRQGRSAVVVLADGENTAGSIWQVGPVIDLAQRKNVPIYSIGLDVQGSSAEAHLREMARQTGGKYYAAPSASDLTAIYQNISQQLQTEYQITYSTPNPQPDGTKRTVRVRATYSGKSGTDTGNYTAPTTQLPVADYTYTRNGLIVTYDASSSYDPDGSIAAYSWDFDNDGVVDARGQRVTHTFPADGTYDTKLTVKDNAGATGSVVKSITVPPGSSGSGVSIALEDGSVAPGGQTTLTLSANASAVAGYGANITFDPSVVSIASVSRANFTNPTVNIDNTRGYLTLADAQAQEMTNPALAEITVTAAASTTRNQATLSFVEPETTLNNNTASLPISTYDDSQVSLQACTPGDANQDGQVTPLDATLVLRHYTGLSVPGSFSAGCADADQDGQVTPLDATTILRMYTSPSVDATPGPDSTQPADMYVDDVSASSSDHVVVDVYVRNASAVAGYGANITFDPSVVEVSSVKRGDLGKPVANVNNQAGYVHLAQSSATTTSNPTLARINFSVIGSGGSQSPLSFVPGSAYLNDQTSQLPVTVHDGSVQVTGGPATGQTVRLVPASNVMQAGQSRTFDVVLDSATNGVGAFDNVTVATSDVSVAEITSVSGNGGFPAPNTGVSASGDKAWINVPFGGDTTDTGSVTLATVTVDAQGQGTAMLDVTVTGSIADESGSLYSIAGTSDAVVNVSANAGPPPVVGNAPPTDPDGDGRYEDVNGNGGLDVGDVQALFANRQSAAVQNNPSAFDFNANGAVDVGDVQSLFVEYAS